MSFISRGSARFNWHFCTVPSLKVPARIVYDMVMNVLDKKLFPQHNIAGRISGITSIVLFQSGEASTVEGNKYTHTDTLAVTYRILVMKPKILCRIKKLALRSSHFGKPWSNPVANNKFWQVFESNLILMVD